MQLCAVQPAKPVVRKFITDHTDYYTHDKLFQVFRWTDCNAFDAMVAAHRRARTLKFHNLKEGVPDSMHPFVNGPLSSYMDYLKGGRKDEGRSSDKDPVVARTEEYWTHALSGPVSRPRSAANAPAPPA